MQGCPEGGKRQGTGMRLQTEIERATSAGEKSVWGWQQAKMKTASCVVSNCGAFPKASRDGYAEEPA